MYSNETIDNIINDIINSQLSFKNIAIKYQVSAGLVGALNQGKHSKTCNMNIPLRATRYQLTEEQITEIYIMLQNTEKTLTDIALQYNISLNLVSAINTGRQYTRNNMIYPLRSYEKQLTEQEYNDIINQLQKTKKPMREIGILYNISEKMVSEINLGNKDPREHLTYPIRKSRLQKQEVNDIISLLLYDEISIQEIAKRYGKSKATIYNINNGQTFRNKDLTYPLRIF